MNTFDQTLTEERKKFQIQANGGISLPAAGCLYWLLLSIGGIFLTPHTWSLIGFMSSGIIFPLGLLLSKPLKSKLLLQNSLSGIALPAMSAMFMVWPMIIAGFYTDVQLVPLFLAIGMSLHWPVIGWMYRSKVCMWHAIIRVIMVTSIWVLLPEFRFTLLPFSVTIIYLITIFGLKSEVRQTRHQLLPH